MADVVTAVPRSGRRRPKGRRGWRRLLAEQADVTPKNEADGAVEVEIYRPLTD
jgi:hypothetical protein